jgi:hypothetical protein
MSDDITINVTGLDDIRRALQSIIPEHFQGAELQKMLTVAAVPVIAAAKALAPAATGTLRGGIYSFKDKRSIATQQIRGISVRSNSALAASRGIAKAPTKTHGDAYYWVWIEYGHAQITAAGRTLGTPTSGFFGKVVAAYPAHPFMRPAFDTQKYAALEAFQDAATKQLSVAASKT